MNIFKSKFFLIMLAIAVFVVSLSSLLSLMGHASVVRNAIGVVSTPFRVAADFVCDGIEGFAKYFSSMDKLIKENEELKDKVSSLEDSLADAEADKKENEALRDYLGAYESSTQYYYREARVIGLSSGNYTSVITLSVGSLHGIEKDMPIITSEGIVGRVSEVGLNWCRATTILEQYSAIGAMSERGGAIGILEGGYAAGDDGFCYLKNIKPDADIVVGDRVISSGTGSIYPYGFELGEVVELDTDPLSRTLVAKIKPAVDFSKLDRVMILTGIKTD